MKNIRIRLLRMILENSVNIKFYNNPLSENRGFLYCRWTDDDDDNNSNNMLFLLWA
jgi:hypothetical protein